MGQTRQARRRSAARARARSDPAGPAALRRVLRENGLSIVLAVLFLAFLVGQSVAGMLQYNGEQAAHGEAAVPYLQYLASAHFYEALAENWESEFLQLFGYVILTAFLYQKGSAESKKLDQPEEVDRHPSRDNPDAPWPVRRGGLALRLYQHSLSLAFLFLFLVSFALHAVSGARDYSEEQLAHGERAVSALGYVGTARFWFESLQNWQSEFLALLAMVILSIFLRQRGSPESKPVDAPHSETGGG